MDRNFKNACRAFYKEYMDCAYHGGNDHLNRDFLFIVNNKTAKENALKYGKKQTELLKKELCKRPGNDTFLCQKTFKVTYPGALIGSGYPHITGKMKGEFQNGFCFDHITGIPYYPGSSLKGVIEDPFERSLKGRKNEKAGYLSYLLQTIKAVTGKAFDKDKVTYIWNQSFQGLLPGQNDNHESMFNRDIFYDSFITDIDFSPYNKYQDLIREDYITPHKSPLDEPTPITVLRLMPGVKLTITMLLHSVKDENGSTVLTSDEKAKVFCEIIKDMGIGSRTNLGYGVLDSV